MEKYVVTIETNQGTESVCRIAPACHSPQGTACRPKRDIATEEEVRGFLAEFRILYPDDKYKVYTLKEVILPYTQI